jgi:hypothetical protein
MSKQKRKPGHIYSAKQDSWLKANRHLVGDDFAKGFKKEFGLSITAKALRTHARRIDGTKKTVAMKSNGESTGGVEKVTAKDILRLIEKLIDKM